MEFPAPFAFSIYHIKDLNMINLQNLHNLCIVIFVFYRINQGWSSNAQYCNWWHIYLCTFVYPGLQIEMKFSELEILKWQKYSLVIDSLCMLYSSDLLHTDMNTNCVHFKCLTPNTSFFYAYHFTVLGEY